MNNAYSHLWPALMKLHVPSNPMLGYDGKMSIDTALAFPMAESRNVPTSVCSA